MPSSHLYKEIPAPPVKIFTTFLKPMISAMHPRTRAFSLPQILLAVIVTRVLRLVARKIVVARMMTVIVVASMMIVQTDKMIDAMIARMITVTAVSMIVAMEVVASPVVTVAMMVLVMDLAVTGVMTMGAVVDVRLHPTLM
jgi:hypothetical protein